jgi:lambda repressor-like predicted transcriptional regulator
MSYGWIKVHRSMNEWGWKTDPNVVALWVHILTNANFDESYFLGHLVKRGELACGLSSLSQKTGLSVSQVRTALNKLQMTREIAIKSHTKFSIISITKWDLYQDNRTLDSNEIARELADESQRNRNEIATSKKIINKEDKKEEDIHADFLQDDFERVWAAYPDNGKDGARGTPFKGSKAKAKDKFATLYKKENKDGKLTERIIAGCGGYKQFLDGSGYPTKHLVTWLNQRCWESDYAIQAATPTKAGRASGYSIEDVYDKAMADKTYRHLRNRTDNQGDNVGVDSFDF